MELYERTFEENVQYLHELLEGNRMTRFRTEFLAHHSYDQAQLFKEFSIDDREKLYQYLSPSELANLLDAAEFQSEHMNAYFEEMNNSYAAGVLGEMYADNAVDVLNSLEDRERVSYFMHLMKPESAREISQLINYLDDTAGSIMTTEFVSVRENVTVAEAYRTLKDAAIQAETIYYVYVVDDNERLTGVTSLRDLIVQEDERLMKDVMYRRIISVQVNDDQAEVARMVKDYDLLALPVVGFDKELLGIITVDDILDVMDEEAASDYSGLAGVDVDSEPLTPIEAAKNRLPWLIVLVVLGLASVWLISRFTALLAESHYMMMFTLLLTGTAGNAGTQSLAVAIRGLSTKSVEESIRESIVFELWTGITTGLIVGGIVAVVSGIWIGTLSSALILGVSMSVAILIANLLGALIPNVVTRFGLDTTLASSPLITTLIDFTTLIVYLTTASLLIT